LDAHPEQQEIRGQAMARRRFEPIYHLAKSAVIPWAHVWFRWQIEGIEKIPKHGPAILAWNHIAYLDPLAISYVVVRAGRRPRFLTKSELFQDRRIRWALSGSGQIEVKRGTRAAPVALDHALEALDRGEVVIIFPEGTVTTDPELNPRPAKSGVARLALKSGVPVIPCAIWGTANVWPKGYAHRWRPRQDIVVRIGDPVLIEGDFDTPRDWQTAGKRVMDAIAVLLAGIRPAVPDTRRPKKPAA
jgi:1-acyl-sn-glycerol-3-phosphate acyltransferase